MQVSWTAETERERESGGRDGREEDGQNKTRAESSRAEREEGEGEEACPGWAMTTNCDRHVHPVTGYTPGFCKISLTDIKYEYIGKL